MKPRDGGASFLDDLLAADAVFLELDLGWAWYAGVGPALPPRTRPRPVPARAREGLLRAASPARSLRVRRRARCGYERVAPAAIAAGAEWLLVEQDETDGPSLEAARRSFEALTEMVAEVTA